MFSDNVSDSYNVCQVFKLPIALNYHEIWLIYVYACRKSLEPSLHVSQRRVL